MVDISNRITCGYWNISVSQKKKKTSAGVLSTMETAYLTSRRYHFEKDSYESPRKAFLLFVDVVV
jgi:hypothetical protein